MHTSTTLNELEMSHTMRRTYRRRVLRWLLTSMAIATVGSGCVHSPESRLTHATSTRFFPVHHTAVDSRRPVPALVDGYAYGYHQTQWRQWADEWLDEGMPVGDGQTVDGAEVVNPGAASVLQPTPIPAPAERSAPVEPSDMK